MPFPGETVRRRIDLPVDRIEFRYRLRVTNRVHCALRQELNLFGDFPDNAAAGPYCPARLPVFY